jgi:hypothetical protein
MTVIIDHGMSSSAIIQPRPAASRSSTSAMQVPMISSTTTVIAV